MDGDKPRGLFSAAGGAAGGGAAEDLNGRSDVDDGKFASSKRHMHARHDATGPAHPMIDMFLVGL